MRRLGQTSVCAGSGGCRRVRVRRKVDGLASAVRMERMNGPGGRVQLMVAAAATAAAGDTCRQRRVRRAGGCDRTQTHGRRAASAVRIGSARRRGRHLLPQAGPAVAEPNLSINQPHTNYKPVEPNMQISSHAN